jgi:hypothetical protein
VTVTRITMTADGPMVVDVRNLQEVAVMTATMAAGAMIVVKEQTKMMTTRVPAKLREDAAEDHQAVAAAVRLTMGRVETLTTVTVAQDDHASEIDVANRTRSKYELPLKLPQLPKSAGEFGSYRFAVINHIALATGGRQKRIPWIEDTTKARHPEELEYVPRKNKSLDYKISVAALASCQSHRTLYGILRREGRESGHAHLMPNGRQCLWRIYTFYALPGMETRGLTITCAVIDLVSTKLVGGDEGLGDFWNRWCDCFVSIRDPPERDDYEYVFVGEMRPTTLMVQRIRDYDEMDWNDPNKSWQWLIKKGRASYDRARKHDNHIDTLHVLSGSISVAPGQHEMAFLAIEDV